jgi:hypothetical protein
VLVVFECGLCCSGCVEHNGHGGGCCEAGRAGEVFFFFFFFFFFFEKRPSQGYKDQVAFTHGLFCKVLGIDVMKNHGAKAKPGYVQKVPLNFADVHVDERLMPAQGEYTDKDGNVILGVSRVFKEDLPTFGYYDMVAAVADMSRKVNALEALLLKLDPEAAAEYAEAFPKGVPPTHQPMIPMQGDGNSDFRNVSDGEWKHFGANAEKEKQEIKDRDDERYRRLTGGKEREQEEEVDSESPVPKRKTQKKKKNQNKKRRNQKNKKQKKQEEEEEPLPLNPRIVPMAGKTMRISELEEDSESSEVEQEVQQHQDEVVIEVHGKLNKEVTRLLAQQLDGKHWAESNQIAASAAYAIMTGKRPYQYSDEEEEEEEEDSHSVIEIEDDDDDEEKRMVCGDLQDEIIVLSDSEDDDLGVQPMDQQEEEASPSLFQYDSKAEALHFTPVVCGTGGGEGSFYDLTGKPSEQELNLLLSSANVGGGASLDLWGPDDEPLCV